MPAKGTGFGTILVSQEVFGVNEHIADACRSFAKAGYYAIAPDFYFRYGDPKTVSDVQVIIRDIVSKTNDAEILGDFDSSTAFAKGEGKADTAKLGITGFYFGGRVTWMYSAHNPDIMAGVAWYGRLVGQASAANPKHPVDIAKDLKGPVLGLYGAADQGIPLDTVEKMKEALKEAARRRHRSRCSKSIRTRHTRFTPTTGRRIVRKRPRTAGSAASSGSAPTARPA